MLYQHKGFWTILWEELRKNWFKMLIQVEIEQNTIKIAKQYILSNFTLLKNTFFKTTLTYYLKWSKKDVLSKTWKKIWKNLEEIVKTWKKFRKLGENVQKSFGHPEYVNRVLRIVFSVNCVMYGHTLNAEL